MPLFSSFKRVDFYRKVPIDLTEPTAVGAIISIVAALIMLLLFVGEIRTFVSPPLRFDLTVAADEGQGSRMKVTFNMTYHKLPCFILGLDILNVLGHHEINHLLNTKKVRLSKDGESLGEEDDPDRNRMLQEGCNIAGYILVHKVPGNFHVSAHGNQHLVAMYLQGTMNVQHTIYHMHFGEVDLRRGANEYDGELLPLNGESHIDEVAMHYHYFLDIIPTVYKNNKVNGQPQRSYQFTAVMHKTPSPPSGMPAVYFQYQMSPITVSYTNDRESLSHFLTYICAIVGGVFTVSGIVSRMVHTTAVQFQRRMLGKDQ